MRTNILIVLIVLFTLWAIGCNSSTDNLTEIRPGQVFGLKLGQSAAISEAGLVVTFKAIAEDSRCPEGAVCISAGNAKVLVSVSGTDAPLNTTEGRKEVSQNGYTVQLIAVTPYPKLDEQPDAGDYEIKLVAIRE